MSKKKRSSWDLGRGIIVAAIIVSMPRWAGAFISADVQEIPTLVNQVLYIGNLVSGIGMAIVEVVGAAYLLDAWGHMKPRRTHNQKRVDHRWKLLTISIILLFTFSILILAPYMVARMNGRHVSEILPTALQYIWNGLIVVSPALIVGGVAIARDGLVSVKGPKAVTERAKLAAKRPKAKPKMPNTQSLEFQALATREKVRLIVAAGSKLNNVEIGKLAGVSRQRIGELKRMLASENGQGA